MSELLVAAALSIAGLMVLTWLVSLVVADVSIVDMVWGLGFVVAVWAAFLTAGEPLARGVLAAVLVTVWGLRLTAYLVWRNLGEPEDYRYQAMRRRRPGSFWIISLFQVFALQGVLMWVVALPPVLSQGSGSGLNALDFLGVLVFAVGLFFETAGDYQLARFKADPDSKGKVMDRGLWRYTRHPNYFGDFCVWWGIFLVAAAGGLWWTVFSPIVMSILLLRVSGVALLEKTIQRRRPEYADYAARTNAFFPGPPKDVSSDS